MARIYGLNGVLRGRQGNNVFSVQNGTQVVKAYQPAVSNPRTKGQRVQRAKFALAGKISGVTPSDALIGMAGGSPRARRAEFVRRLALAAVTQLQGADVVASVPYADVVYSVGNLAVFSAPTTPTAVWYGTEASSRVQVTIPAMSYNGTGQTPPAGYGELAVVALYDAATSRLDECVVTERSATNQSIVVFRQGDRRDCRVAVYIVPFVSATAVAGERAGNLSDTEAAINLTASITSRLASARFGMSILVSTIGVIGSNQSHAVPPANDDMRGVVEDALMSTAVSETQRKN